MQQYAALDQIYELNIRNCMQRFDDQMNVRLQKTIQCIEQIALEFNQFPFKYDVDRFPEFPYNKIKLKRIEIVNKFKINMNKWVDEKIENGEIDSFTKTKCKQQAEQQYDEEGEWFMICFIAINRYIGDICDMIQGIDDRLKKDIKLFMIQRHTLILFKRTHKFNKHSGDHPIFRSKAFIECKQLHNELDTIHPKLSISEWIIHRKEISKKNKKRAIGAKEFCNHFIKYMEYLYYKQYEIINNNIISIKLVNIYYFDDQHMIICSVLETEINHININHDIVEILKYFGQNKDIQSDEKSNDKQIDEKSNNTQNVIHSHYNYNNNQCEEIALFPPSINDNNNNNIEIQQFECNELSEPNCSVFNINNNNYYDNFDNYSSVPLSTVPSTPMSNTTNSDSYSMLSSLSLPPQQYVNHNNNINNNNYYHHQYIDGINQINNNNNNNTNVLLQNEKKKNQMLKAEIQELKQHIIFLQNQQSQIPPSIQMAIPPHSIETIPSQTNNHNFDGIPRDFQMVNPSNYSIRPQINRERDIDRRNIRRNCVESNIQQIRSNFINNNNNNNINDTYHNHQ